MAGATHAETSFWHKPAGAVRSCCNVCFCCRIYSLLAYSGATYTVDDAVDRIGIGRAQLLPVVYCILLWVRQYNLFQCWITDTVIESWSLAIWFCHMLMMIALFISNFPREEIESVLNKQCSILSGRHWGEPSQSLKWLSNVVIFSIHASCIQPKCAGNRGVSTRLVFAKIIDWLTCFEWITL